MQIFEQDLSKSLLYGSIAAAIIIVVMIMINPVMGYTIDAKIDNQSKLTKIKITPDNSTDKQLPNATIIDTYNFGVSPQVTMYPSQFFYSL